MTSQKQEPITVPDRAEPTAKPEFTDRELRLIFTLVRTDALERGAQTTWTNDNKSEWPARLHTLLRIANKIHRMRGHYPLPKP